MRSDVNGDVGERTGIRLQRRRRNSDHFDVVHPILRIQASVMKWVNHNLFG